MAYERGIEGGGIAAYGGCCSVGGSINSCEERFTIMGGRGCVTWCGGRCIVGGGGNDTFKVEARCWKAAPPGWYGIVDDEVSSKGRMVVSARIFSASSSGYSPSVPWSSQAL